MWTIYDKLVRNSKIIYNARYSNNIIRGYVSL